MARCHRVLFLAARSGGVLKGTRMLQYGRRPIFDIGTASSRRWSWACGAEVEGNTQRFFGLRNSILDLGFDVLVPRCGGGRLVPAGRGGRRFVSSRRFGAGVGRLSGVRPELGRFTTTL